MIKAAYILQNVQENQFPTNEIRTFFKLSKLADYNLAFPPLLEFLKAKLDDYLQAHLPKVRVIHLEKRSGLIRARLAGARAARGEVLIFLDSHTECTTNWLPPLLGKRGGE